MICIRWFALVREMNLFPADMPTLVTYTSIVHRGMFLRDKEKRNVSSLLVENCSSIMDALYFLVFLLQGFLHLEI